MSIRVLPPNVVNKIAAGEVIERPASVVKELVENAVDAGAARIQVDLENGGAKLIRVVDNGCGMDADDLELVLVSHATSKLEGENDLFDIRTMGFRGEALASIGAVSEVRIASRTHASDAGHETGMDAGERHPLKACGTPPGTCVEVRNLFHNVPVRKKFLKTTATEMAHITEALTRLAIVRPRIHFALTHNGRDVFNLPPADDEAQRIGEFFGREIAENLVPFAHQSETGDIEGYLLPPHVDRRNTRMQYTYVNRRYVRNSTLMHAIAEAYRGLIATGRRPACFAFLTIDPHTVDVNVHPTKLEIKFRRQSAVHQELLAALRDGLRHARLTPQVSLPGEDAPPPETQGSVQQAISDFFAGSRAARRDGPAGSFVAPSGGTMRPPAPASGAPQWHREPGPLPAGERPATTAPPPRFGNCIQMLDSYIVEETEDGIDIIDQHALHERLLYNQISRRLEKGVLDSQQLLVPELVELPQQEFYAVMDLQEDLARFGMDIEAFGERTVIVRSFPQIMRRFDGKAFFEELLVEMEGPAGVRKVDGRLDRLVKVMACKAAVKAGERLSPEQLRRLLEQRAEYGPTDTCPHGRPTVLHLSRRQLDKQFRRT